MARGATAVRAISADGRQARAGRKDADAGGFTLIELLVVLAIIAALLTMVPSLMAGIPGFRLRAATAGLADTLRQLHDQALRTGAPAVFVLDAAHRRFATVAAPGSTPGEPVFRTLPEVVDAVALATASPLRPGALQQLIFFADGSATGASLRLLHGQHAASIGIDWLTGRVTTDD